jgi:hypothetical protein
LPAAIDGMSVINPGFLADNTILRIPKKYFNISLSPEMTMLQQRQKWR